MSVYDYGDPVTLTLAVAVEGVPTDASTVQLLLRDPAGTETTAPHVRTGVGTYEAALSPALAGLYLYRWVTTGTGAGAEAGSFRVLEPFAQGYATVADVRAASPGLTVSDLAIRSALYAAEERIDRFTGDRFAPQTLTLRAEVGENGIAPLPRRLISVASVAYASSEVPLVSLAWRARSSSQIGDVDAIEVATNGSLWTVAGAEPYRGGWANLHRSGLALLVTGSFGWAETPDAVRDAAVLLALAQLGGPGQSGEVNLEGDADLGTPARVPELVSGTLGSTGSTAADELLAGFRLARVRIS